MKILFYTDTPNIGGAEKQMLMLAKHLKLLGHSVSLAYGKYSKIKTMHNDFAEFCENIYVLNTLHKHDPRHYKGLKSILKKNAFDVLHLHLWNPGGCRYAFFAGKAAGVPVVTTEHDPFSLHGMKKVIKLNALKKTAQTIAICHENRELLIENYDIDKEAIHVVHNGIETWPFTHNTQKTDLPINKGDTVVICIAEMHPRKGHKTLFNAFLKLQQKAPSVKLVLVGTGPEEANYKKEYGFLTNVHFLGWRNDIPQLLAASDILVLPSLKEAFGLVILEAMASHTVAIATDNGGAVDIIEHGKTGYLVPPENSQAIVDALFTILQNPDQKRDIEKAAFERVEEHFTAQVMAKNTADIYKKAISSL